MSNSSRTRNGAFLVTTGDQKEQRVTFLTKDWMWILGENERWCRVEWATFPMVASVVGLAEPGWKSRSHLVRRRGGSTLPLLLQSWLPCLRSGQMVASWSLRDFARRRLKAHECCHELQTEQRGSLHSSGDSKLHLTSCRSIQLQTQVFFPVCSLRLDARVRWRLRLTVGNFSGHINPGTLSLLQTFSCTLNFSSR